MGYSFYPQWRQISSITNAVQAAVTFTADHEFTPGEYVSFRVTKDFGMFEINNKRGKVLSVTSDAIVVDIDTTTWSPFTTALLNTAGTTPPTCVPSSSGVIPFSEPATVTLIDTFDNRRT